VKRLALFVCLSALAAFGQGGAVTAVPTITNTRGEPVPYAKVAVCSANPGSAPATVCNGLLATISTDVTLGTPCATNATPIGAISGAGCTNPGKSDGLGNVVAFAPAGQYWCEYFGGSISQPLVIPCFFASGGGGSAVVNCPTALNGSIAAFLSTTSLGCDKNAGTNFSGDLFGQSWSSIANVLGFVSLVGGLPSPGADVKYKLPTNTFRWLAPATVATPYYFVPPPTRGTPGQVVGKLSETTDGNGDPVVITQWQNSVASAGVEAQTNGVDNINCVATVCPLVNLTNSAATFDGYQVTVSNPSGGVQTHTVVTPNSQISTPSAPTLANNNAAGARSITYLIQACEDGSTCGKHTLTSATATIANANASPQVLMTAYGSTLYGPRCFDVYVTADSGARTGVPGRIANCVGKSFIDTGGNASGGAATNTNTTVLIPTTNPTSGGCNYPAGSPQGVDGLPCSPKALDDEFTNTQGSPGDANNPMWTRLNWGTTSTTYSSGELLIAPQIVNAQNQIRGLTQPIPATPYTVVTVCHTSQVIPGAAGVGNCGILVSDGTKGITFANGNNSIDIVRWTTLTNGFSAFVFGAGNSTFTVAHDSEVWVYLRYQDTGTNAVYSYSFDGINYITVITEVRTVFLTPSQVGIFTQNSSSTSLATAAFDYFRQTQ
jgi:hypothetical protein